eukprot:5077607-Pyramimonas_sp.AAC.1
MISRSWKLCGSPTGPCARPQAKQAPGAPSRVDPIKSGSAHLTVTDNKVGTLLSLHFNQERGAR